ncbi:MAG TPA: hypothetical protein D7H91_05010, partial [Candidatus Poseidoniales archaeon]
MFADIRWQNQFRFFGFNVLQAFVNSLSFTFGPNLTENIGTVFFRNIGVVKNVFGSVLVFQVLLTVQFFLLLLPPPAFLVKASLSTSTVLLWGNFCLNLCKDI